MKAGILLLGVGAAVAAIAFGRRPAIEAAEDRPPIVRVTPPWQSKTTPTPEAPGEAPVRPQLPPPLPMPKRETIRADIVWPLISMEPRIKVRGIR